MFRLSCDGDLVNFVLYFFGFCFWLDSHLGTGILSDSTPMFCGYGASPRDKHSNHGRDIVELAIGHGGIRHAAGCYPSACLSAPWVPRLHRRYDCTIPTEGGHDKGDY